MSFGSHSGKKFNTPKPTPPKNPDKCMYCPNNALIGMGTCAKCAQGKKSTYGTNYPGRDKRRPTNL